MLLRAYPNPATCHTGTHFEMPNSGLAQVSVFDPVGRRVRVLSDGLLNAGVHELLWDGLDQEGRAVPAGTYLIRAATPQGTRTTRCVILR